jgi:hypothetical protein
MSSAGSNNGSSPQFGLALPTLVLMAAWLAMGAGCTLQATRPNLPSEVEAAIGTVSEDIAQQRYEKLYNESSDLWQQAATMEQSTETLKRLEAKLGRVESRNFHSATEQNNSGGPLKGRAFIVTYQTKFERGAGMETFTLVERENHWLLARYFVNSTALN